MSQSFTLPLSTIPSCDVGSLRVRSENKAQAGINLCIDTNPSNNGYYSNSYHSKNGGSLPHLQQHHHGVGMEIAGAPVGPTPFPFEKVIDNQQWQGIANVWKQLAQCVSDHPHDYSADAAKVFQNANAQFQKLATQQAQGSLAPSQFRDLLQTPYLASSFSTGPCAGAFFPFTIMKI
jgi:hypothetical protein